MEDAAIALFMEQGYHATSMRQIADRAGLPLGGIYNHFTSKEELFEAIVVDKHPYKRILSMVMETPGETAEEFLRNAFKITVNELGANPIYIKLMMIEMVEFDGRHGASMLKEIAPKVLPVFEQMVKVRKGLRISNPPLFLRSFCGMIISYFITEMVTANSVISKLMPKDAADVYIDGRGPKTRSTERGISTPRGESFPSPPERGACPRGSARGEGTRPPGPDTRRS